MKHYLRLAVIYLLFFVPFLVLILYTLTGIWRFPSLLPETWSLRAVRYVAANISDITVSLLSSAAYSLCTVFFSICITLLPASVFARRSFAGKHILEALFLSPVLLPSITFSMGAHYLFILAGLSDTFAGIVLVLTLFSYPYMLRALTAGFQAYGPEYEQCAENLGAGVLARIFTIDLPLLLPSLVSGGTIVFLVAFSEYFLVFLIGGGGVPSFSGYLFPFITGSDRAVSSILSLIFLLFPVLLFFIVDTTVSRALRKRGMQ